MELLKSLQVSDIKKNLSDPNFNPFEIKNMLEDDQIRRGLCHCFSLILEFKALV